MINGTLSRACAHPIEKNTATITTSTTAADFQRVAVVNMVVDVADSFFTTLVKWITRLVKKR